MTVHHNTKSKHKKPTIEESKGTQGTRSNEKALGASEFWKTKETLDADESLKLFQKRLERHLQVRKSLMKIKQNNDLLSKRVFSYKSIDPKTNEPLLTRESQDENLGYWKSWYKQNETAKDMLRKVRAERRIGKESKSVTDKLKISPKA